MLAYTVFRSWSVLLFEEIKVTEVWKVGNASIFYKRNQMIPKSPLEHTVRLWILSIENKLSKQVLINISIQTHI